MNKKERQKIQEKKIKQKDLQKYHIFIYSESYAVCDSKTEAEGVLAQALEGYDAENISVIKGMEVTWETVTVKVKIKE